MSNSIRIKNGLSSTLPVGSLAELLWTTDTNQLYVGTGSANVRIQTGLTNPVLGTGTTNELTYWTSANSVGSLTTATYPSLTELSYVKGVTSAIQTQLNSKAAALSGTTNFIPKFTSASAIGNSALQEVSGNLGLGVTPSAWNVNGNILEIGYSGGNAAFFQNGADDFWTTSNAVFNSGWKYVKNGTSTAKLMSGGSHIWYNAPSGTAGNAISFTQAMTLGSNSGLSIGTTSAAPSNGLLLAGALTGTSATFSGQFIGSGDSSIFNGGTANNFNNYALGIANTKYLVFVSTAAAQSGGRNWSGGIGADSSENVFLGSFNNLSFGAGSLATRMTILGSNGNVGIGTTSPAAVLDVSSNSSGQPLAYFKQTGSGGYTAIQFSGNNGTDIGAITTFNGQIYIGSWNGVNGSLGQLQINKTTGAATFSSNVTATTFSSVNSTPIMDFVLGSNTSYKHSIVASSFASSPASSNILDFRVANGANSQVTVMNLTGAGNVGIGTSLPFASARLQVNTGTNLNLAVQTGTLDSSGIKLNAFNDIGNTNIPIELNGSILYFKTAETDRGRITSGGNWLLGTSSDNGERLYVSGAIRATGTITANSDISLKKNLLRIENALEKVEQISGYTYNLKDESDTKRYGGVVAQEIESVFPEIVSAGNDGLKGVEYGNISALLIEAIKELSAEINILKNK